MVVVMGYSWRFTCLDGRFYDKEFIDGFGMVPLLDTIDINHNVHAPRLLHVLPLHRCTITEFETYALTGVRTQVGCTSHV